MMEYANVIGAVYGSAWAVQPEKLDDILAFLQAKAQGVVFTHEQVVSKVGEPKRRESAMHDSVAVMPLHGVIGQRMNMFLEFSGGTSTEKFGAELQQHLSDQSVSAIVIDVDSPGGSVFGVETLAAKIQAGTRRKPIYAVANSLMSSAAYWLGSAATQVIAVPGSQIGSIGVLMAHKDFSKQNEMVGVKPTYIFAGEHKVDANQDNPLSDEARAHLQASVDEYYSAFVAGVAKGRNTTATEVKANYGKGRVLSAQKALEAGMIDRIGTLESVIRELVSGKTPQRNMRVEMERVGLIG